MKRFQIIVLLGLFSLAVAQKPIVYRDNAKSPKVTIQGNKGFLIPGIGAKEPGSFELTGSVQIKRVINGEETTMLAEKASGVFYKANGNTEIDKVRMTGGMQFTQGSKKGTTIVDGDSAEYDLKDGAKEINITGQVKISFNGDTENVTMGKDGRKTISKVHSTMTSVSKSATITFKTKLDDKKKEYSEIQSAIMRGPIQFSGVQLVREATGDKTQKVTVKADQMRYTINGASKHPEVTLEGNLAFNAADEKDDGSVIEGGNSLVLELNEKNQILKMKFVAEEGKQIKSTFIKGETKVPAKGKKGGA